MAGAQAAMDTSRSGQELLGIYLNDHLAGATSGAELAPGSQQPAGARQPGMPCCCSRPMSWPTAFRGRPQLRLIRCSCVTPCYLSSQRRIRPIGARGPCL